MEALREPVFSGRGNGGELGVSVGRRGSVSRGEGGLRKMQFGNKQRPFPACKPKFAHVDDYMSKLYEAADPLKLRRRGSADNESCLVEEAQRYAYKLQPERIKRTPSLSEIERCLAYGGLDDDEEEFKSSSSSDNFSALTCCVLRTQNKPKTDIVDIMEARWSGYKMQPQENCTRSS